MGPACVLTVILCERGRGLQECGGVLAGGAIGDQLLCCFAVRKRQSRSNCSTLNTAVLNK